MSSCTTRPSRTTATRSASARASVWSWVTNSAGTPALTHHVGDHPAHPDPLGCVQVPQRLVEQEGGGDVDQGAARAPPARARRRTGRPDGGCSSRPRPQQRAAGAQPVLDLRGRDVPGLHAPGDVVPDVEEGHQAPAPPTPSPGAARGWARRGPSRPPIEHVTALDRGQPGDRPQHRGLAAARGAEDGEQLGRPGEQGDVVQEFGAVRGRDRDADQPGGRLRGGRGLGHGGSSWPRTARSAQRSDMRRHERRVSPRTTTKKSRSVASSSGGLPPQLGDDRVDERGQRAERQEADQHLLPLPAGDGVPGARPGTRLSPSRRRR